MSLEKLQDHRIFEGLGKKLFTDTLKNCFGGGIFGLVVGFFVCGFLVLWGFFCRCGVLFVCLGLLLGLVVFYKLHLLALYFGVLFCHLLSLTV